MIALDLVIVTYNRLEKLKHALRCYEKQTRGFRNLIVVNNCSTDGTKEFLREWTKRPTEKFHPIIINTDENLGGSGGFYLGEKKAMELNADWVYVADDDAYAEKNMIEEFYKFIENHDCSKVAAVCAEVLNPKGKICLNHRYHQDIISHNYRRTNSYISDYENNVFLINGLTYVGSFINSQALEKYGLVNRNYFIYYDDSEHSLRLNKYGDILVVPNIKITHDAESESFEKEHITWKDFYAARNITNMLLKHFPIAGVYTIYKQIKEEFHIFRTNSKRSEYTRMASDAVWCAFWGKLGKHKMYKPGWISNQKL